MMSCEFNIQYASEVMMGEDLSHNAVRLPSPLGFVFAIPVLALSVMSHAGL